MDESQLESQLDIQTPTETQFIAILDTDVCSF